MAEFSGVIEASSLDEVLGPSAEISESPQKPGKSRKGPKMVGGMPHGSPLPTDSVSRSREWLSVFPNLHVSDRDLLVCLMSAGGRRDVAYGAVDRLLAQFGTFASVIAASPSDLAHFGGLAHVEILSLKAAQIAALRMVRSKIENRPVLSSMKQVHEYLIARLSAQPREEFRVLFLDSANHLIADETVARGTVNWVAVKAREVMERTLKWRATALILCHNHPSGDPTPSGTDILTTKWITDAVAFIDVVVRDHIIVSEGGVFSLRDAGLLPRTNQA